MNVVIKWKVRDAWAVVRRERYNNTKVWRDNKRVLPEEGVVHDFNRVWEKEKRRHWLFLRKKRKRRVKFLLEKFGAESVIDCVTEVEGITVADQSVPSTFSSNPRRYGGVQLTKDEEKVLCLPPKFAVYEKINLISCEAQIEKGLAKLRWSALRKADDETADAGEREVEQEEERAWPFDMENDFALPATNRSSV